MILRFTDVRFHCLKVALCRLAVAAGTASAQEFTWRTSTPEEQGIDSAGIGRMFAQIQREAVAVDSFVLIRHERVVAEAYFYPYAATTKHTLYSVSKSFTSALVGIAIEQGLLGGVDDRLQDIFRGVNTQALAERMSRMRLRHVLSMSTGHTTDTTQRITYTYDWAKTFMELPVEAEPGSVFVYNSGGSYMLAAAVQRKAGTTAAAFAQQNLFGPLGITDYTWDTSPTNVICGGWGLSLRPLDMARFGLMYLHNGQWNGRQVVPAAWVAECSRKQADNGTGGFWGSGYGYQFWLNDFGGYRADGALAQYIFILPAYDTVAVFTCSLTSDTERPGRYVREHLLPAMQDDPRPANPRGEALLSGLAAVLGTSPYLPTRAPTFTVLPSDQAVAAGDTANLTVAADGRPAPTVQWYKDERMLPGATTATLTLARAQPADAGRYVAVLRNASGAVASTPITLTVLAAPGLVAEPGPMTAAEGGDAVFQAEATGDDLRYEWRRNGGVIAGATEPILRRTGVTAVDAGDYTVEVHNARGSVTSRAARLTVAVPDPRARLVNLSARARAGADDQTLIVGLVIDGSDRTAGLPVLLRGLGPALTGYGVTGELKDPAVILHREGTAFASNGDWHGAATLANAAIASGAVPLPTLSADAAMQRVLKPGSYSLHLISGLPDRAGVATAECYDASGGVAAGSPRLMNLSARAEVRNGEEALIGGFVIAGAGTQRVLIRGVGPTLAAHGVNGVLADPKLEVFSKGEVIASNDDWAGDAELKAVFAAVGAFELPADSHDAARLVTLPAGVYSAHVTGKAGATGVALVEIYAVP